MNYFFIDPLENCDNQATIYSANNEGVTNSKHIIYEI